MRNFTISSTHLDHCHFVAEHDGLRHQVEGAALPLVRHRLLEEVRACAVVPLEVAPDEHLRALLPDVGEVGVEKGAADVQVGVVLLA